MRIRIKAQPDPSEFVGYDLRRFRVGETYEVSPNLASLLIVAGYADVAPALWQRAEAADRPPRKT